MSHDKNENMMGSIKFDSTGLIPAIIQDAHSGSVLMLAYMNEEALQKSLTSGQTYFWSRSRQELWHKGETSGNFQEIAGIQVDCDEDALLVRVNPEGPACHTGNPTCFFRKLADIGDVVPRDIMDENLLTRFSLDHLYTTICERRDHPTSESYTARLIAEGEDEIVKKIGEEAVEVILAAKSKGDERVIEEVSDLVYHVLVLLASRQITPEDVRQELARRHR